MKKKKSIYEKYHDFVVSHELSRREIIAISTEYANTPEDFAGGYFAKKYNISIAIFRRILDFAIVICFVDENVCRQIQGKCAANYRKNNPHHTAMAVYERFQNLFQQRNEFLEGFSKIEIQAIGYKCAEGISINNISIEFDTGCYAIKKLLEKGISNLIIDATTAQEIRTKHVIDKIFFDQREKNKEQLINCLKLIKESIEARIQCAKYNPFERHSILDLQRSLENTQTKIREATQL